MSTIKPDDEDFRSVEVAYPEASDAEKYKLVQATKIGRLYGPQRQKLSEARGGA